MRTAALRPLLPPAPGLLVSAIYLHSSSVRMWIEFPLICFPALYSPIFQRPILHPHLPLLPSPAHWAFPKERHASQTRTDAKPHFALPGPCSILLHPGRCSRPCTYLVTHFPGGPPRALAIPTQLSRALISLLVLWPLPEISSPSSLLSTPPPGEMSLILKARWTLSPL